MKRLAITAVIATLAINVVLMAAIASNLTQVTPRPPVVDNAPVVHNGWREPAWFPPERPTPMDRTPRS